MQGPASASPILKTQGDEEERNLMTNPPAVIGSAPSLSASLEDHARRESGSRSHSFESSREMPPLPEKPSPAVSHVFHTPMHLSGNPMAVLILSSTTDWRRMRHENHPRSSCLLNSS